MEVPDYKHIAIGRKSRLIRSLTRI